MSSDTSISLTALKQCLNEWLPISEFQTKMNQYFLGQRPTSEIEDFRAKRGELKKLRDEVTPALHYVKFFNVQGEIRFQLDDDTPDCWCRTSVAAEPQGIEITIAQSREGYELGKELNEKGEGRGYLGLPDNASSASFSKKLASPRVTYSTESALRVIGNGIKSCLRNKTETKYAGYDLLIEAPLRSLPRERWSRIYEDLSSAASETPFRKVFVIGNHDSDPFGFRIKG